VPNLVVIHFTAMGDAASALDRLCDPTAEVSAHYLIGRTGTLWQLVSETHRAWHAGAGAWGGQGDVNSRSIGIELDNDGATPFAALLMDRLEILLDDLMARWAISPAGVIGHADMAPGRKSDPGPRFDWLRLARGGRALQPRPHRVAVSPPDFVEALRAFGYAEASPDDLLSAFRARFRPAGRGPLAEADCALAAGLAGMMR